MQLQNALPFNIKLFVNNNIAAITHIQLNRNFFSHYTLTMSLISYFCLYLLRYVLSPPLKLRPTAV